jgi:hypothetical protein
MILVAHVAIKSRVQYVALEEAGSVVDAVESESTERRATSLLHHQVRELVAPSFPTCIR